MIQSENFRFAILAAALGFALTSSVAQAQQPRYSSGWSNPDEETRDQAAPRSTADLDAMIKELRSLTREAERHRAADPNFLSDLKNLARRYSWPWKQLVVFDNFRDGDLTRNPTWTIKSGSFEIGYEGLITSFEGLGRTRSEKPRRQNSDDIARELLGGLLGDLNRGQRNEPVYNRPKRARISLKQPIPNRFAITLKIRSRTAAGTRFEFGVGQGKKAIGYYLVYRPGGSPALSLERKNSRGRAVIEAATGPLKLEDEKLHTLMVTRNRGGHMVVSVDGDTKIRIRDRSFRDPFDRFVITNRGGRYAIRSVAIHGATGPAR